MKTELMLRTTNKWADGYAHLDQWESVGTMEEISNKSFDADDGEDLTEPRKQVIYAIITSAEPDEKVKQALHTTYTRSHCTHEFDCCGCRSFRLSKAERVTGDLWCVEVGSSRNY